MQFQNSFEVDAPIEQVWETVLDVERVTPNVPGARVLERTGDNAYKVAIKVKVGPMSMTYNGEVEITDRDDAAHRAVMKARAKGVQPVRIRRGDDLERGPPGLGHQRGQPLQPLHAQHVLGVQSLCFRCHVCLRCHADRRCSQ